MSETVLWYVSGLVQGVGFRLHVLQAATRLGVRGDVSNLKDGRVRVRAVADGETLAVLRGEIENGPGRVSGIETASAEPMGDPQGFVIARSG